MIDHLRHMAIFARVVAAGSFRGAAGELGLAPSRVSQMVSDLEAYLGTTLLYRTTRKIALTDAGRQFHGHVTAMLEQAEAGLNDLNARQDEPVGALRISLPGFLSSSGLTSYLARFLTQYPQVALTISYTDRRINLIEDGFDMSIRVGWLSDSTMMSRKLGEIERLLVAGLDYAASRPRPCVPGDLESWDWIRFRQRPDKTVLRHRNGDQASVIGRSRLEVDSADAMAHLAQQNMGASVLPAFLAQRGIENGHLVRLLPGWTAEPAGIYAIWPDRSRRDSLTRLLVRFLAGEV